MAYHIRPLDHAANTAGVECGEPALDGYLQRHVTQDIKRAVARIFIATPDNRQGTVAAFHTLSAASIAAGPLPEKWRKKLPRYPLPVALLGRLAVSQSFQGRGPGGILLADAIKRVVAANVTLAVAAIIVDAKSDKAARFYRHFGFGELPGCPGRWMLPLRSVRGENVRARTASSN